MPQAQKQGESIKETHISNPLCQQQNLEMLEKGERDSKKTAKKTLDNCCESGLNEEI